MRCSVSYMHLAERQGHYSIGIFLFRDGANLPLHDHESMSVYSRCASQHLYSASKHVFFVRSRLFAFLSCRTGGLPVCRLLFGKIRMQSYDWVDGPPERPGGLGKAEYIRSVELNGGDIASLYPQGGNMHAFQAVTPAAVLDVLVPGYTNSTDLLSPSCSPNAGMAQQAPDVSQPMCHNCHHETCT